MVVITGLLLHVNLWAQTPPITLHVETAGRLSSMIAENRKYEITDLTLTGNLDSRDIRFIREMAGRNYTGGTTNGKLASLNLAGANIVSYSQTILGSQWRLSIDETTCYYNRIFTNPNRYNYYHTSENTISSYMFADCTSLTSITIPNSVTSIRSDAFRDCTSLTSVTIGNSVTSIGGDAFWGCTSLTNVTIGNNVTSIGHSTFRNCTSLTSITIPNSVKTIENSAFRDCTSLTSITIPNSVTSIGGWVFSDCTSLTNVTIGNSVTSIGQEAFSGCTSLTSVTIGNSVTSVRSDAFWGCRGLTEFIVSEQNTNYSASNGVLFNKNKTTLILYPIAKSDSFYAIPNSVTSIGSDAFSDCTSLTSITIPNSVTSIESSAFRDCTSLAEIYSKNPIPPTASTSTFNNVNKATCKLHVPKGSYTAYWVAVGWGDFDNIIETDFTSINTINKDSITINPISNGITIEAKEQIPVSVYNLTGQIVYQSVIDGNMEIALSKGVYVVRVNNESQKIIVR